MREFFGTMIILKAFKIVQAFIAFIIRAAFKIFNALFYDILMNRYTDNIYASEFIIYYRIQSLLKISSFPKLIYYIFIYHTARGQVNNIC